MTLYKKVGGNAVVWNGEPINFISYPMNIEALWSNDDLNSIGLYKVNDPGAPAGQIVTDSTVTIVNGNVSILYTTVAPSPDNYPLTARQLRLGLIRNNISLSRVTTAINNLPNQQLRDEALVYWEYSTTINWVHPMTQTLLALVGIPTANAQIMWMAAKDYEA